MKLTPLLLLLALSARADIVFLGPPIVYGDVSVAQSADSVTASAYPWGGSGLAYLSYSLAEQVQVTTAGDYTLTDTVTISRRIPGLEMAVGRTEQAFRILAELSSPDSASWIPHRQRRSRLPLHPPLP